MTNLNSFSVAGNLTGDPRIKTDENGEVRSVLFNVAVNRSKDKADFIPVRLSGTQYTAHMQQKLVTVSYTHLDVYKRQAGGRHQQRAGLCRPIRLKNRSQSCG